MSRKATQSRELTVLRSKRHATRYQILVEIAERQPAVSQREIASVIGISPQAVSDYFQDLLDKGHVTKEGRGRYRVSKTGVDWLISQTDDLQGFLEYVSSEVVGAVEIETALSVAPIEEGETVSLSMRDGVLHARPGDDGTATAVAVTDATANEDVGVTDFDGLLDHRPGEVTIMPVPDVQDGGSSAVDLERVRREIEANDLIAIAGTEPLALLQRLDRDPDLRFGTRVATEEAATKGFDTLLLTTVDHLSTHTDHLRDANVSYRVLEGSTRG